MPLDALEEVEEEQASQSNNMHNRMGQVFCPVLKKGFNLISACAP